jgi:hypothetical protein
MNAPWPEPICRINLYLFRCWTSDESFDKFVQLATHTALGELFIPDASRRAQGGGFTAEVFFVVRSFSLLIPYALYRQKSDDF